MGDLSFDACARPQKPDHPSRPSSRQSSKTRSQWSRPPSRWGSRSISPCKPSRPKSTTPKGTHPISTTPKGTPPKSTTPTSTPPKSTTPISTPPKSTTPRSSKSSSPVHPHRPSVDRSSGSSDRRSFRSRISRPSSWIRWSWRTGDDPGDDPWRTRWDSRCYTIGEQYLVRNEDGSMAEQWMLDAAYAEMGPATANAREELPSQGVRVDHCSCLFWPVWPTKRSAYSPACVCVSSKRTCAALHLSADPGFYMWLRGNCSENWTDADCTYPLSLARSLASRLRFLRDTEQLNRAMQAIKGTDACKSTRTTRMCVTFLGAGGPGDVWVVGAGRKATDT